MRTCPVCFEDLDKPNLACPAEENHSRGPAEVEHSSVSADAVTWGIIRGKKIHLACATPEEMSLSWAGYYGRKAGEDDLCEVCFNPLDTLP